MFGFTTSSDNPDAIELLKNDHDEVDELFEAYDKAKEDGEAREKTGIAGRICRALSVHAAIEEEIFYPAVRRERGETGDLVDEAAVEHQTLKDIIGRLEAAPASDPLYDAGVKVLKEYVKHHVKEEENELFPKVRKLGIDLTALGAKMKARKEELEAQEMPAGRSASARRLPRSAAAH